MPGESINSSTINNTAYSEAESVNNGEGTCPKNKDVQIVREITLTDKLNKKLLSSFLVHLNSGNSNFNKFLENNSNDKPRGEFD